MITHKQTLKKSQIQQVNSHLYTKVYKCIYCNGIDYTSDTLFKALRELRRAKKTKTKKSRFVFCI